MMMSSSPPTQLVDDLRFPRALGGEDAGDLVVEAAVAAVFRQALDHRVDDLDAGAAASGDQALPVRDHNVADAVVEVSVLRLPRAYLIVVVALLKVDDEQGSAFGLDRPLPERHVTFQGNGIDFAALHRSRLPS